MKEFKDLVKMRREELGLTMEQVAAACGVSRPTVSRWESGEIKDVRREKIIALAKALRTTPAYLLGMTDEKLDLSDLANSGIKNIEPLPPIRKIPLIGEIACGEPITAEDHFEGSVDASGEGHANFCLRCKGDSMAPMVIDGDLVFIHQQEEVETGETAAVLIGNEATLKHVYYNGESLILAANNPAYAPMTYSGEQLNEIRILGKAVMLQRVISNKRKF